MHLRDLITIGVVQLLLVCVFLLFETRVIFFELRSVIFSKFLLHTYFCLKTLFLFPHQVGLDRLHRSHIQVVIDSSRILIGSRVCSFSFLSHGVRSIILYQLRWSYYRRIVFLISKYRYCQSSCSLDVRTHHKVVYISITFAPLHKF